MDLKQFLLWLQFTKAGQTVLVVASACLLTAGFTVVAVLIPSVYSMLIDFSASAPRKGTTMGWLGSSTSIAKIFGPLLVLLSRMWYDAVPLSILAVLTVTFLVALFATETLRTGYIKAAFKQNHPQMKPLAEEDEETSPETTPP